MRVTIHFSAVACLLKQGDIGLGIPSHVVEVKTKHHRTLVLRARELIDGLFAFPGKFVRYVVPPHFAADGRLSCSYLSDINKKTIDKDMYNAIIGLEDGAADGYLEGDAFIAGTGKELVLDDAHFVIDEIGAQFSSSEKTYWRTRVGGDE